MLNSGRGRRERLTIRKGVLVEGHRVIGLGRNRDHRHALVVGLGPPDLHTSGIGHRDRDSGDRLIVGLAGRVAELLLDLDPDLVAVVGRCRRRAEGQDGQRSDDCTQPTHESMRDSRAIHLLINLLATRSPESRHDERRTLRMVVQSS